MNLFYIEAIAFISGILNIYLLTRCSLWNWLFGVITVLLYAIIFFSTKLYADMGLQGVFLVFQFYGLYQWCYGSRERKPLTIQAMNESTYFSFGIVAIILFVCISFILKYNTDSTTIYVDAAVTAFSLIAQWMMSKKYLQHWILWIFIDLLSICLYINKELYLTAVLYSIFMLLCVKGYFQWKENISKSAWSLSIA
jgi:nicotinamide mononucleotide transporter